MHPYQPSTHPQTTPTTDAYLKLSSQSHIKIPDYKSILLPCIFRLGN